MKKQATTTAAQTKNFCAQISVELAAQIETLAAQNGLNNKPQTLAYLLAQTLENIQKSAALTTLRVENIDYLLECYIVDALQKSDVINKASAQNFIQTRTGKSGKINVATIDYVFSHYTNEILAHAQKHGYKDTARFEGLMSALNAAKEKREKA